MLKTMRVLITTLSLMLLVAGGALAGPGTRGEGDPDQPQKTPPGKYMSRSGSVEANLQGTSTLADEESSDERWQLLYRTYLQILQIIVQ